MITTVTSHSVVETIAAHENSLHAQMRTRAAELGLSQTDIGAAIGASQNTVSRLLRGKSQLSVDQIVPLEQLLKWPGGYVAQQLGIVGVSPDRPCPVEQAITASSLDIAQQEALLRVYRLFVEQSQRSVA